MNMGRQTAIGLGMASRRQYKYPPIEEAVCELRFNASGWDITWPGQLFNLTKKDYSAKPRSQQQSIVSIEPGTGLTVKPELLKTQLVSADGKRLLGIAPGTFSIHELRPYSGWESFHERIRSSIQSLLTVANEIAVSRIGIRYINRIPITGESAELSEFFTCVPDKTGNLPEAVMSFFARVDFAYPQDDSIVRVTFASGDGSTDELIVMLDIDAIWENQATPMVLAPGSDAIKKFDLMLCDLRDRERNVFEGLITDKTRKVFDAEVSAV
jgi:uncharacterized protein (TIGR04255 family)